MLHFDCICGAVKVNYLTHVCGGRMKHKYEPDNEAFPADAYNVDGEPGIAWHVLGWELLPSYAHGLEGEEVRTGRLVMVMVGDDAHHVFYPSSIHPLTAEEYCGSCGQIGCGHG